MTTEAATPTGGAETSAPAQPSQPQVTFQGENRSPVQDRLKALLTPHPQAEEFAGVAPNLQGAEPQAPKQAPKQQQQAKAEEAEAEVEESPDADAQEEQAEAAYESLDELADALGWDLDKVLNLETRTKIDGKDGKARLRDLVKSYQLEGHLNQKLMAYAEDKKAFEVERQNFTLGKAEKFARLDQGLQILERALAGDYAHVNWDQLRLDNPVEFNSQYVNYQQRLAQLQNISQAIAAERQAAQEEATRQHAVYLDEQRKLLHAKVPEWADEARRKKDRAEISAYVKEYGISDEELDGLYDHRHTLILRDAWNWHKLQKAKPATLNKVKAAPKLLKPGTTQSRAEQNSVALKQDRERLRQTGKPRDAAHVFKRLGVV